MANGDRRLALSRPWRGWVLTLMLGWLALAQAAWAQPIELVDDRGRRVTLLAPPQRVVSVLPSLTETVCALQQCPRLVGVDRDSSWPAAVRKLPKVGSGLEPSVESIVALRPDVVLVATSTRGAERLEALGLRVVALEPRTHADVQRVMSQVARVLGTPPALADQAWRAIEAALDAAAQTVPQSAQGLRVYFEVNRAPYAASESSFIGETLARLGARSIVPAALGPFPKLNPEFVVRADPDVIMIGDRDAGALMERPGWARLRALREQRLCLFTAEEADTIVRPGPRMAEGARLLAGCLARHGDPAG